MAEQGDWVSLTADKVVAEGTTRDGKYVCASGISPSGPIHLGNLREIMVPHLVADELKRRGLDVEHLLSWDDYDRLRKVPAGVPAEWAEHVGRPLTAVPDPCGEHASWADHFREPFQAALRELGVSVREISQTEMYRSGAYVEQVRLAMRHRDPIDAVLGRYRTKEAADADSAAAEDGEEAGRRYFPFRPYCAGCGRDTTHVETYDDDTCVASYTCDCGHSGTADLTGPADGKLVWKVDWPMRWAYEAVTFEAGGVDHSSPGSSFTVGSSLVREVFGHVPPVYVGYSFVGIRGAAKMSGSAGGAPTPGDALRILEPPVLRWLYARRKPNQSITVAFDAEVIRLYDEWDASRRKDEAGELNRADSAAVTRATSTAEAALPLTPTPLPFRMLTSVVDITAGDETQMLRILRDVSGQPVGSLDDTRPRLDRAEHWVADYLPAEERTHPRTEPDAELLASLPDPQREALRLLLERLDEHWSHDRLTDLVYGVPKLQAGLPLDAGGTPELKVAQREFFALLYRLLVSSDTGPRLPTLLLALGQERVRRLLGGEA